MGTFKKSISALILLSSIFNIPKVFCQDVEWDSLLSVFSETVEITEKRHPAIPALKQINIAEQNFQVVPRLQDFLNTVPGLEMQSASLNTNRIHIRGIGSRSPFATSKIRAYLDDIPLTDGIGETSLEDINLGMIDQMVLWRGPTTSLYGAGLGGTILLKSHSMPPEKKWRWMTDNSVGAFGFFRSNNDLNVKWSDHQHTYLNAEWIQSDGYRENNEYKKQAYTLFHKWSGEKSFVSFFLNHIDLFGQIPSSLNFNDYKNNPRMAAPIWAAVSGFEDYNKTRAAFSFHRNLGKQLSWITTAYTSFFDSHELRPFDVIENNSWATGFRSRIGNMDAEESWTMGIEWYREDFEFNIYEIQQGMQGPLQENDTSIRYLLNVFGEKKWKLNQSLILEAGVNVNITGIDLASLKNIDRDNDLDYKPIISPRTGLSWLMDDQWSMHLDIGHGFATPGLDESILPNGRFNPDIRQEKAWNFEYGINGTAGKNWKFSSSFFFMIVDNILVNRQTDDGFLFAVNAGRSRHYGWEPEMLFQTTKKNHHFQVQVNAGIGNYRFLNFVERDQDFSGNQLTGVAPFKSSINIKYQYKTWNVNLLNNYVSAMPVNDENSVFSERYFVSRLFAGKKWFLKNTSMDITASVDNLFNIEYSPMIAVNALAPPVGLPRYFYPGMPRNFTVGLKFHISGD